MNLYEPRAAAAVIPAPTAEKALVAFHLFGFLGLGEESEMVQ
jgi:hypothetical protein